MVEINDIDTLRDWKALRADLLEPKFLEHRGQLHGVAGDAVLIEFPSAVEAVDWALEIQRALSQADGEASSRRIQLRIAINVDDVIVDEETIIGDGVNIAARILPIASPGEIVVTGSVREYVLNKMPITFADLGERELRNISRSIRVYRIDDQVAATRPGESAWSPHRSWSRRPGIVVLPFRNMSGAPEERYFSDGISEDIISGLSRSHALHVIAWSSTLRYRDRQMDLREIASELGVRYVLEGGVRRRDSRVRISTELIDATNSRALWSDRFDGAGSEVFEIQDRITSNIVGTIEPKLYQAEAARIQSKPTDNLDAYDCLLRAMSLLYTLNDDHFAEAGVFLRRATVIDPDYAQAHAYFAWWLNLKVGEGRSHDTEADIAGAEAAAAMALQLDVDDAFCLAVAAHVQSFLSGNLDAGVDLFDRALKVNENSAFAWGISGSTYAFLGRPDEALDRLRNAWRLSPFDPLGFWFCTVAGISEFVAARYDEAVAWLRKAQRLNPRFLACQRTLAASLAMAGELDAAHRAGAQLLALDPPFRVSQFIARYPLRREGDRQRLGEGLRLAGLPE